MAHYLRFKVTIVEHWRELNSVYILNEMVTSVNETTAIELFLFFFFFFWLMGKLDSHLPFITS